jgi:hypothetical protein
MNCIASDRIATDARIPVRPVARDGHCALFELVNQWKKLRYRLRE